VIPRLKKINSLGGDFIDQAMLLSNPPAPVASEFMFERLRLADAVEGVGEHCFYQFQDAESCLAVRS